MFKYYRELIAILYEKLEHLRTQPLENLDLCLEIQEELIRRVTYFEKRIRQLKGQIKDRKRQLANSGTVKLARDDARAIKNDIEYRQYLIDEYQHLQYLFRSFGDGLAFTYLDKWDIKPMAFKEAPGTLSGKKGTRKERKILRELIKAGVLAILNDVTNCLRYGDLTLVRNGLPLLIEVKSGKSRNDRTERQIKNLEKMMDYFYTDSIEGLYKGNYDIRRIAAHSKEEHHIDELNEVISEALVRGTAWMEVEKGLYYYATLKFDITDFESVVMRCSAGPACYYLNTIKYDNTGYLPFTLSIKSSDALWAFYSGTLSIFVIFDPSVLIDKFASKGLIASFEDDPICSIKVTFMEAEGEDKENFVGVSSHMLGRIACDFQSLNWFVEEISNRALRLPELLGEPQSCPDCSVNPSRA